MLLLSWVFPFLLWVCGVERSLFVLGGETLPVPAKISWAGSGCRKPSVLWLWGHWCAGSVSLLGFILSSPFPLSSWQSIVALNRRYMTCENKWWTAAWALGLGPSEQVRRGPCMSGKSHFQAIGLVLHKGCLVQPSPCLPSGVGSVYSQHYNPSNCMLRLCTFWPVLSPPGHELAWLLLFRSWMTQYGNILVCSNQKRLMDACW